jgi:tetratricopeptide (TPR) repeat protein
VCLKNILYVFLIGAWLTPGLAVTNKELQELRYTKALVAFNSENYAQAGNLIQHNMDFNNPHVPSFELLAKIHEKRGDLYKAMKVYYYLVKKQYNREILKTPKEKLGSMRKFGEPSASSKQHLFKIATLYIDMYNKRKPKVEEIRNIYERQKERDKIERLLTHSEKYLYILEKNKFEPKSLIKYNLGIIYKERKNKRKAADYFEEALLAEETSKRPDKDLVNMIEFYLGDTLIEAGRRELATKYFKSINDTTQIESLKNFSRQYLDTLTKSSWSYNIGATYGNDANPFNLDTQAFTLSDINQTSTYEDIRTTLFYNSAQTNDWAYTWSFNFNQLRYADDSFRTADSRNFKMATEIKFYNLPHSVKRINLSARYTDNKQDAIAAWRQFSNQQSVGFYYDDYSKTGIYTFGIPVTRTSYQVIDNQQVVTTEALINFAYQPWTKSRIFSPSFSLSYGQTDTDNATAISRSDNLRLYITNQTTLTNKNSLLTSISFTDDAADNSDDSLFTASFSFASINDISHIIPGAVLEGGWVTTLLRRDTLPSSEEITKNVFYGSLDFYF